MTVKLSGRCGSGLLPAKMYSLEFGCNFGFSVSRTRGGRRRLGAEPSAEWWLNDRGGAGGKTDWLYLQEPFVLKEQRRCPHEIIHRENQEIARMAQAESLLWQHKRQWFNPRPLWYTKVSLSKILKPRVLLCMNVLEVAWSGCPSHYCVNTTVRVTADQYITFMLQLVNQFTKQEEWPSSLICPYSSINLQVYMQSVTILGSSAGLGLASSPLFLQETYLTLITSTLVSRQSSFPTAPSAAACLLFFIHKYTACSWLWMQSCILPLRTDLLSRQHSLISCSQWLSFI